MKACIIPALAVLGVMNAAHAYAFDASQCARISDIDVPYQVSVTAEAIRFHGDGGDIIVTPTTISSGERRYSGALAGGYYAKVRQFLTNATAMSQTANPFDGAGDVFAIGSAATNMCQAILDMAASNQAIVHDFEGFAPPVKIVLR